MGSFQKFNRDRRMFKAVCGECGQSCEVPFQPSSDKPVYCDMCFRKKRGDQGGREHREHRDFHGSRDNRDNRDRGERRESGLPNAQLEAINSKLDKLIGLLTQSVVKPEPVVLKKQEIVKAPKEIIAPKATPKKEIKIAKKEVKKAPAKAKKAPAKKAVKKKK